MEIQNRIKELRYVEANPNNWRRHPKAQKNALKGILSDIGYADALIAYETEDGLMLIDGHLRAETTPDMILPVLVTDLNETEANKLLATLDPLAAMAENDATTLAKLLEHISLEETQLTELLKDMATVPEVPLPDGNIDVYEVPTTDETITAVIICEQSAWSELQPILFSLQENDDRIKINIS
jgi:hypothetical protein